MKDISDGVVRKVDGWQKVSYQCPDDDLKRVIAGGDQMRRGRDKKLGVSQQSESASGGDITWSYHFSIYTLLHVLSMEATTDQTARPILTHSGSTDSVWSKGMISGVSISPSFV